MMKKSQHWISKLNLLPHPEGGFYSEVYRSEEIIPKDSLNSRYNGARATSTSIYFLLNGDDFSAFHKIKSDELWHFYDGSSVNIILLSNDGVLHELKLGINENESPQIVIPKGTWFAAHLIERESFSLIGCTVSPGFDFDDFELAKREELFKSFPEHKKIIEQFTRI
jgi:predicted cupin superfamily sugar epimerase